MHFYYIYYFCYEKILKRRDKLSLAAGIISFPAIGAMLAFFPSLEPTVDVISEVVDSLKNEDKNEEPEL